VYYRRALVGDFKRGQGEGGIESGQYVSILTVLE